MFDMKQLAIRVLLLICVMVPTLDMAASTVTYYHNDLAGSPVVATNETGQVVWRESYRPYGERLTNNPTSSSNDVWFTSRRQDAETGLVYMGARYYDPTLGRFLSTDPKDFDDGNIHSFNRYAYANNNPYRYVDRDGREPGDVIQRGYALPIPNFSLEPGLIRVIPEAILIPGGIAKLISNVAKPDEGPLPATTAGEDTFRIVDGVRRSKAAELCGKSTICAEVEGTGGKLTDIPIESLRSPKDVIETTGAVAAGRWAKALRDTKEGTAPPILVGPGSSGIPIRDVKIQ
jgi:RHS repeat-associated protein